MTTKETLALYLASLRLGYADTQRIMSTPRIIWELQHDSVDPLGLYESVVQALSTVAPGSEGLNELRSTEGQTEFLTTFARAEAPVEPNVSEYTEENTRGLQGFESLSR